MSAATTDTADLIDRLRQIAINLNMWTCTEAADTIAALLRERDAQAKVIAQLQEDTSRLDWLRGQVADIFQDVDSTRLCIGEDIDVTEDGLREAIDAARAGLNTQGSGNG